MVLIHKNNQVVSRSSNLRGILRYAGKHGVKSADAFSLHDGDKIPAGRLVVMFDDGAWAITDFASYTVLVDWIEARKSWAPNWPK